MEKANILKLIDDTIKMDQLDLSGNQLRRLPTKICNLTNLSKLNLLGNQLRSLPPEIGKLTNLTVFYLARNQLSSLPPEIGKLTNLTDLYLENNQLRSLPPEIGKLMNLTTLDLGGNQLNSLPAEISKLINLTKLSLWKNQLSSLFPEIFTLTNLTTLNLGGNDLRSIPAEISKLTNLTELDLGWNQLNSLPPEIGKLTNLHKLNLENNPLKSLPPEIVKQGDKEILEYLKRLPQKSIIHNEPQASIQGIDISDRKIAELTVEKKRLQRKEGGRHMSVFLCHSSDDKLSVQKLYQQLLAEGFDPWLDEEKILPGQDWKLEIRKAVKVSDVVIVCLSSKSVNKTGYIQKEIKSALDVADEQPEGKIFLIPLKLEECVIPERLSRWQWVNLYETPGYERLMRALRKVRGDSEMI